MDASQGVADRPDAEQQDEVQRVPLPYGELIANVEYRVAFGCVEVLGAEVDGLHFDAECFPRNVTAGWRRAIERSVRP